VHLALHIYRSLAIYLSISQPITMRRGNLRGSSDKSILDPTPNRSSSGFKLLAPLVIATIIICVIYLLNTESHTAVTADNSTYHGKTKNPLVIVGDEFFNLPTGDKQLHYITGGQGDPLFILVRDSVFVIASYRSLSLSCAQSRY